MTTKADTTEEPKKTETQREVFERLALGHLKKLNARAALLSKLAAPSRYPYTKEDAEAMRDIIRAIADNVYEAFFPPADEAFKLPEYTPEDKKE